ncbi:hypothetical protein CC80DRAFT_528248 [Byssothecium circinans]|uniref:Uncharacterized protein n=1 Tax=Byssothecium circinans TaxID=147558 RepID=A0A6A5TJ93_9PLEO|nr:hypothetical protein CC80DRAFT_528248 [Byssothecium circinans]
MQPLLLLLSLLCALALAQTPASSWCQCPQVKCPADDEVSCPTKPPATPTAPSPVLSANAACECEPRVCAQNWPDSCYCGNANKQACFNTCGGIKPSFQPCPPRDTPSVITTSLKTTPKSTTTTTNPLPSTTKLPPYTHAPCGGGRANYTECTQPNYMCIKDPYRPGCGPECDGPGICVEDRMCGGFAGYPCPSLGQRCVDDPRDGDDCDPRLGAADCGGLCVWPH